MSKPEFVGRYRILELVGEGSFGKVTPAGVEEVELWVGAGLASRPRGAHLVRAHDGVPGS